MNAWIAARGRFVAPEYMLLGAPRPWRAVDSLLWGKLMGLYLSGNWRAELARAALLRQLPPATVAALWPVESGGAGRPEASIAPGIDALATRLAALIPTFPAPFTQPETASNAWAVDGTRSATGAPLLAGDPHLGLAMPGIWYLARIDLPGRVLAGATAPGVPFMVLGHNGQIAWTFTTTGADVQDLFVETAVGEASYATPDGPQPFGYRKETILIRGNAPEEMTVRETRHGPVISDLVSPAGPLLAIAMANLAPGDTAATGLLALNRAADIDAAGRASALITAPVQNLMVADRQRIGLFTTGRVPIRRGGDGSTPARGEDGSGDWTGMASGADLPRQIAPASGRLVNANERIAPADFPVFLGRHWFADWRARRIRALLTSADKHTLASFAAIQVDAVSVVAREMLPRLLQVAPTDPRSRTALSLLALWDGTMAADRAQPLIFNAWMRRFRLLVLERLGIPESAAVPLFEMIVGALAQDAANTAGLCGGPCEDLLASSLAAAMADLALAWGDNAAAWRWGAAHEAVFAHPLLAGIPVLRGLGERRVAAPGDDTTVFRAATRGASFDAVHGAAFRGVYDLANLERSRFVIAPGQSGNFASPLAWSFVRNWREGGTVTLEATPASIASRLHLMPESAP